jgi:hypothetical protein
MGGGGCWAGEGGRKKGVAGVCGRFHLALYYCGYSGADLYEPQLWR